MSKISKVFLGSLVAVAMVTMISMQASAAEARRLTPVAYCHDTYTSNGHFVYLGYYEADGLEYLSCGIPSDSWMAHSALDTINIHTYSTGGNVAARACVHDYDSSSYVCNSWEYVTGTGYRTIAFTSGSGDLDHFTSYPYWAPSVTVYLPSDGDQVKLLWVYKS